RERWFRRAFGSAKRIDWPGPGPKLAGDPGVWRALRLETRRPNAGLTPTTERIATRMREQACIHSAPRRDAADRRPARRALPAWILCIALALLAGEAAAQDAGATPPP